MNGIVLFTFLRMVLYCIVYLLANGKLYCIAYLLSLDEGEWYLAMERVCLHLFVRSRQYQPPLVVL